MPRESLSEGARKVRVETIPAQPTQPMTREELQIANQAILESLSQALGTEEGLRVFNEYLDWIEESERVIRDRREVDIQITRLK